MSDSEGTPNFDKPTDPQPDPQPDPPAGQSAEQQPGATPPYGQAPYGQPGYGQPGYGAAPYQAPGSVAMPPDQERMWGGAAHWSALVASVVGVAFLGPLIIMLTKGNESAYVRRQAVESLNFQLSMLIYGIVSAVLMLILIGFLLILVVGILWLVFTVMASVKASNGEEYHYPLTIRMVS